MSVLQDNYDELDKKYRVLKRKCNKQDKFISLLKDTLYKLTYLTIQYMTKQCSKEEEHQLDNLLTEITYERTD